MQRSARWASPQHRTFGFRGMKRPFQVLWTADFYDEAGAPKYRDLGASVLAREPRIQQGVFSEHRKQISPDQLAQAQGVIVLTPQVTAETVSKAEQLLVVARFGVGYDSVDVNA